MSERKPDDHHELAPVAWQDGMGRTERGYTCDGCEMTWVIDPTWGLATLTEWKERIAALPCSRNA